MADDPFDGHLPLSWGTHMAIAAVRIYRACSCWLAPGCCRFRPTCSTYAVTALQRFGLWSGGLLMLRRIVRCHPFYHGNLNDPVPRRSRGAFPRLNKGLQRHGS